MAKKRHPNDEELIAQAIKESNDLLGSNITRADITGENFERWVSDLKSTIAQKAGVSSPSAKAFNAELDKFFKQTFGTSINPKPTQFVPLNRLSIKGNADVVKEFLKEYDINNKSNKPSISELGKKYNLSKHDLYQLNKLKDGWERAQKVHAKMESKKKKSTPKDIKKMETKSESATSRKNENKATTFDTVKSTEEPTGSVLYRGDVEVKQSENADYDAAVAHVKIKNKAYIRGSVFDLFPNISEKNMPLISGINRHIHAIDHIIDSALKEPGLSNNNRITLNEWKEKMHNSWEKCLNNGKISQDKLHVHLKKMDSALPGMEKKIKQWCHDNKELNKKQAAQKTATKPSSKGSSRTDERTRISMPKPKMGRH